MGFSFCFLPHLSNFFFLSALFCLFCPTSLGLLRAVFTDFGFLFSASLGKHFLLVFTGLCLSSWVMTRGGGEPG